jgi:hypothetical protein
VDPGEEVRAVRARSEEISNDDIAVRIRGVINEFVCAST